MPTDNICNDSDKLKGSSADLSRVREIEQSITKRRRFKENIFSRFTKAVVEFDMIKPYDKIAVCISGGKDSMLMAKLFQELKRHDKFPFELEFIVMDPGYSEPNRRAIEDNSQLLGIPIHIFETRIFDAVYKIDKSPCYLCARMRRGHLYKQAQLLGCNKIALGHHYDDVIETTLMGMLWGGQIQTMMPKLRSTNYEGMELIRPLYYIREDDIEAWRDFNGLRFLRCACRFTEQTEASPDDKESDSKRLETKRLIRELKKSNPHIEANIFNSMRNVNVDTVIAYKKDGVIHRFTDDY
jgi:tRNA(Ile)-lysidine synthase TilS/MesJ